MAKPAAFRGVLVPALTPIQPDLTPDPERFVTHCRWLLDQGAHGLAVFGTTSEANSLSIEQRVELLDRLIDAGLPPARLMPGTGACALADAVRLTLAAVTRGCGGVLALPPFYYKGVSDDGLFAFYAALIERVGDNALRLYLYHIPPIAQVPISLDLVDRLARAFPDTVVGIKDSSGQWENTAALLERFPQLAVFPGSESMLMDALPRGGAGCISATANVNAAAISQLIENWRGSDAAALQARVSAVRKAFDGLPLVPALKATLAERLGDADWGRLLPPLTPLKAEQAATLRQRLEAIDFRLERLPAFA